MTQKLKVAIIGCGGIAEATHNPRRHKIDHGEMRALCNIMHERSESAVKTYGTDDAKTYNDYLDVLQDKSIDVVHVCTPNHLHADITVAALESGKHVMCEKPMAKTSEEAYRMVEAAERTGKKLTI